MAKPILHPTRFSAEDQGAFRIACAIARATNRELFVVHVADRKELHRSQAYRRSIEDRLEALRHSQPDLRMSTLVTSGQPSAAIVSLSRDHACGLIVMRPSRRGWWSRLLRGSISDQVKLRARCPVLWLEASGKQHDNDCDDVSVASTTTTPTDTSHTKTNRLCNHSISH